MQNILLFGAGKSATSLIEYLLSESENHLWKIIIADSNRKIIEEKINSHPNSKAVEIDVTKDENRQKLISEADIVISMMPPALHILIAKDCILFKKNLLTASYADAGILELSDQAKSANILFLCEMGLDPGIDHMSAMQIIHSLQTKGAIIKSFKSHCGGLTAPENDDNPWRYKISWNPRNVVLAGKSGAVYKENDKEAIEKYEQLFNADRTVSINTSTFSYYPNRNSIPYIGTYGLDNASTFIRTTLRYPDFMHGWKTIIDLGLTNEKTAYDTNGKSLRSFFSEHFEKMGFGKISVSETTAEAQVNSRINTLLTDETINKQLTFLGIYDSVTIINKGFCSAADVLQFTLEKKLALQPGEKDMVVMIHEFEYFLNNQKHELQSSLVLIGDDHIHTAMAKTVGLPLGIAAKLILNKTIELSGVHVPVTKEIYEPVLAELKKYGIEFSESQVVIQ